MQELLSDPYIPWYIVSRSVAFVVCLATTIYWLVEYHREVLRKIGQTGRYWVEDAMRYTESPPLGGLWAAYLFGVLPVAGEAMLVFVAITLVATVVVTIGVILGDAVADLYRYYLRKIVEAK